MSLVFSNNTTNAHLQSHITILAQSTYYNILHKSIPLHLPSVLWHFWLGDRNGIRPVKNWAVGCWQLMPLPLTVSCFSKIQTGFTFRVPAHPASPGQRAVKWVWVCWYLCCFNTSYYSKSDLSSVRRCSWWVSFSTCHGFRIRAAPHWVTLSICRSCIAYVLQTAPCCIVASK